VTVSEHGSALADQLAQWRAYLADRPGVSAGDVAEVESHLLDQIDDLSQRGLSDDEAFLVAVKRLGRQDALARDFAEAHSERLWKQLVLAGATDVPGEGLRGLAGALGFGLGLGLAIRLPFLWLSSDDLRPVVLVGVVGFLVLAGWYAWLRRTVRPGALALVGSVAAAGLLTAGLYPFREPRHTEVLLAIHLFLALWLAVGAVYLGRDWRSVRHRMDFVRFTGELVIYYVLIALGGGVLAGLTISIFAMIEVDLTTAVSEWIIPICAGAGVVVAGWLVEAKKNVVENMAPVLTAVFTPLCTVVVLSFLGTVLFTGRFVDLDRTVLIFFDLLVALVFGLLLFAISARDPLGPPRAYDWMQVILVAATLLVDVLVLAAMAGRIGEYGASPNKLAALGENVVLLVTLARSLQLYLGFLTGRRPFSDLEMWQCRYLPVFGVWAMVVVVVFPPLFRFA